MLSVNDIKNIYVLKFDKTSGKYHDIIKYTLLATTNSGELCYLQLDGDNKKAKTGAKPYIYYTHQTGGEGLLERVKDMLASYGIKSQWEWRYLINGYGIKLYNANDFLQCINVKAGK